MYCDLRLIFSFNSWLLPRFRVILSPLIFLPTYELTMGNFRVDRFCREFLGKFNKGMKDTNSTASNKSKFASRRASKKLGVCSHLKISRFAIMYYIFHNNKLVRACFFL